MKMTEKNYFNLTPRNIVGQDLYQQVPSPWSETRVFLLAIVEASDIDTFTTTLAPVSKSGL